MLAIKIVHFHNFLIGFVILLMCHIYMYQVTVS